MNNTVHEVQAIMGRSVYSGKVLYQIKWKGFSQKEATWESVKVLKNYRDLITQYNRSHRKESTFSVRQENSLDQLDHPPSKVPISNSNSNVNVKLQSLQGETEINKQIYFQEEERGEVEEKKLEEVPFHMIPLPKRKRGRPKKIREVDQKKPRIVEKPKEEKKNYYHKVDPNQLPIFKWNDFRPVKEMQIDTEESKEEKQAHLSHSLKKESAETGSQVRIYYCQRLSNGQIVYILEDRGILHKYKSSKILSLYPVQLVTFLQKLVIKDNSPVTL